MNEWIHLFVFNLKYLFFLGGIKDHFNSMCENSAVYRKQNKCYYYFTFYRILKFSEILDPFQT